MKHSQLSMSWLVFFLIFFLVLVECLPQESKQFGVVEWKGVSLESQETVDFRSLPYKTIAMNVYGRNCPPCDQEIPALNWVYKQLQQTNAAIFMIVDPVLILEQTLGELGEQKKTTANLSSEDWALVIDTLKKEKKEKNIQLPIYCMTSPSFRVGKENWITGTPETILIQTQPWKVYYNFIGPLSNKTNPEEIARDPKVLFFLSQMGVRGR